MDLIVFLAGAALFGGGFFLLLYFLFRKKPLTWPFVLMIFGVIACFAGLLLSSPLTETSASFISTETYL